MTAPHLERWQRLRVPQPDAPLHDYIRRPYDPVVDPAGRAASETLLWWWLDTVGLSGLRPIIERFRTLLGPGETVWGVKDLPGGRQGVELYVYDLARDGMKQPKGPDDPRSVTALCAGLAPVLDVESRLDETRAAYLMCSLELDADVLATGRAPGFRIYAPGNRRVHGYDGLSYLVAGDGLIRENSYLFFEAATELPAVRALVENSLRCGDDVAAVLDPDLCRCFTICFSSKAAADAVYYSRVDTTQLIGFLQRRWPHSPLATLVPDVADDLAHLRWDLGVDFTVGADDLAAVSFPKIGLYGFL